MSSTELPEEPEFRIEIRKSPLTKRTNYRQCIIAFHPRHRTGYNQLHHLLIPPESRSEQYNHSIRPIPIYLHSISETPAKSSGPCTAHLSHGKSRSTPENLPNFLTRPRVRAPHGIKQRCWCAAIGENIRSAGRLFRLCGTYRVFRGPRWAPGAVRLTMARRARARKKEKLALKRRKKVFPGN